MSSSETEATAEAAAMTVESSSEGYKMRNSVVENRGIQRESMMNVHSESQPMSSMNASNNGFTNNTFTNTARIRSPQDNDMQASDASERSTRAGQLFISSENNSEGQSEQTVRYGSNLNSGN